MPSLPICSGPVLTIWQQLLAVPVVRGRYVLDIVTESLVVVGQLGRVHYYSEDIPVGRDLPGH